MDFKDYYQTLGLSKTATDKEIKSTYRKLARKHHPDVNPGDKAAEAKFKEINEAYEVLGDPDEAEEVRRAGRQLADVRAGRHARRRRLRPRRLVGEHGRRRPGGFRTMSEDEMREMFGTENPFSDFFNTFFGGGDPGEARRPRGGRGRSRKGRDLEHEITLSLEDADQGVTRRLALKHDGHARTVDVRIPAGVGDGSRVRVTGEGEAGAGGGAAGDLYLRIQLAPHGTFERKGRDLYTRVRRAAHGGRARRRSGRARAWRPHAAPEGARRARRAARSSGCAGRAWRWPARSASAATFTPPSTCSCRDR